METESQKDLKNQEKKQASNTARSAARYTGIGFQMIAIILIAVWGGRKLDELFLLDTPIFTVVLSLFGVFAAIYTAVKDFLK